MKKFILLPVLLLSVSVTLFSQELSPEGQAIYDKAVLMLDNAQSAKDIVDAFNEMESIISLPQDSRNADIYYKLGSMASLIASQQSDPEMFNRAKSYYEIHAMLNPQSKSDIDRMISELEANEEETMTAWFENQIIPMDEARKKLHARDSKLMVTMKQYSTIYNDPEIYRRVKWKFTCSNVGFGFAGIGVLVAGCGIIGALVSDFESDFAAYTMATGAGLLAIALPLVYLGEIGKRSSCRKSLMRHNDRIMLQLEDYRKDSGITVSLGISNIGHPGVIFTF